MEHVTTYEKFEIKTQCGFFHVPYINCFGSRTVDTAKAAIDRYIAANPITCPHCGYVRKPNESCPCIA